MQRPNTEDGLFHAGNPLTGEKGTPITAEWLNALLSVGTLFHGSANPPDPSLGDDGDHYINNAAQLLFGPKSASAWGLGVSIKGLKGDTGDPGATGDGTTSTTSNLTSQGYLSGDAASIAFDFVGKTISIATTRLIHKNTGILLNPKTLDISALTVGVYYVLYYDTATSSLGAVQQTTSLGLAETCIIFGGFNMSPATIYGISAYKLNGVTYRLNEMVQPHELKANYIAAPASLNFNLASNQIVVGASAVFEIKGVRYTVSGAHTIDTTALASGYYNLYFELATSTCKVIPSTSAIPVGGVKIGSFNKPTGYIEGVANYYLNGRPPIAPVDFNSFLDGSPAGFNFDFNGDAIRIGANVCAVIYKGVRILLGAQTIDLNASHGGSVPSSGGYWLIYHDTGTNSIAISLHNSTTIPQTAIIFGAFTYNGQYIYNIEYCYVNGRLKGDPQNTWVNTSKPIIIPTTAELIDVPTYAAAPTITSLTSADIYTLYDALVAAYPEYVTKTALGNESGGMPLYRYDFIPAVAQSYGTSLTKCMMTSGVHPEYTGIWCLYNVMKRICENWKTDAKVESLRWNTHYIVVPVVNPYGVTNNTRTNRNLVDINRNFPYRWVLAGGGTETYSGASALSELESQYVNQIMAENTDILHFTDFHNFGSTVTDKNFCWMYASTLTGQTLGSALFRALTNKWQGDYAYLPQTDVQASVIGKCGETPPGSIAAQAQYLGYHGNTFEISDNQYYETASPLNSSDVITTGVEAQINWLYYATKIMTI